MLLIKYMKTLVLLLTLSTLTQTLQAYSIKTVYKNSSDSSVNCYTVLVPETKQVRGLLIRDYSSLPPYQDSAKFRLDELVDGKGIVIAYVVSSTYFPELFYHDTVVHVLDEIVEEILVKYKIPRQNIFTGGISSSGTRALRYAQYCEQGKSKYKHKVKAVFVVDSPLDLERFYWSAVRNEKSFTDGMLWEAKLMQTVFPYQMGGTPVEKLDAYRSASVFSASDSTGGNAVHYKNLPILIFHEPDIDWWMNERGAGYYDINSIDLVGFALKLKQLGNEQVIVKTTTGKGFDKTDNANAIRGLL
ncbi:MAG: hypothetical protein R2852_02655 [Bacteroidia bacterium]